MRFSSNFYARLNLPQSILERLGAGEIVFGDGGFVFALEKRGYVKAGPWTPEAAAEHPEAGTVLYILSFFQSPRPGGRGVDEMLNGLSCFSAAAAQRVPAGRLQCHADVHFLRERRQTGEQRPHSALHRE